MKKGGKGLGTVFYSRLERKAGVEGGRRGFSAARRFNRSVGGRRERGDERVEGLEG